MRPSLQQIAELVANEFNAPLRAIVSPARAYAQARRAAVYLAIEVSGEPLKAIARFFAVGPSRACGLADCAEAEFERDLSMASHITHLRAAIGPPDPLLVTPKMEDAKMATAEHFGLPLSAIDSRARHRPIARARQIALREARVLTDRSSPDIGRFFGGRDHTTVLHAVRRIDELCLTDAKVRADVESVHVLALAHTERRRQQPAATVDWLVAPLSNPSAATPPLPRGAPCAGSAPPHASGAPSLR